MTRRELRKQIQELLRQLVRDRVVYQRRPWTMVLLRIQVDGELRETFGFAKVRHPDEWSSEEGINLCEKKAVAALAKEIVGEHPADALAFISRDSGVFVEDVLMDPVNRM